MFQNGYFTINHITEIKHCIFISLPLVDANYTPSGDNLMTHHVTNYNVSTNMNLCKLKFFFIKLISKNTCADILVALSSTLK